MTALSHLALEKIVGWITYFSAEDLRDVKDLVDAEFLRRKEAGFINKIPRKRSVKELRKRMFTNTGEFLDAAVDTSGKRVYSYFHKFGKQKTDADKEADLDRPW